MHTYATTKELKKKAFTVKYQNVKRNWQNAIGLEFTFTLENELEKYFFKHNMTRYLAASVSFLSLC